MILSDREIQEAIKRKQIIIDPLPSDEQYTTSALDLVLGDEILELKIHAGFSGRIVLEMCNFGNYNLRLIPNTLAICQLIFERLGRIPKGPVRNKVLETERDAIIYQEGKTNSHPPIFRSGLHFDHHL